MSNLKTKHILGWMLFCTIMPIIPIVSYFVFLDHSHMRDGGLLLIYPGLAVLLVIPLSLLNLFLFKKNLNTDVAKRIATIPFGFSIVCSGTLFYIMIRFILSSNYGATFMPVFITAIYHVIAFKAIFWFRNKIDQNASTDS
jgi:hypothetical protein